MYLRNKQTILKNKFKSYLHTVMDVYCIGNTNKIKSLIKAVIRKYLAVVDRHLDTD